MNPLEKVAGWTSAVREENERRERQTGRERDRKRKRARETGSSICFGVKASCLTHAIPLA